MLITEEPVLHLNHWRLGHNSLWQGDFQSLVSTKQRTRFFFSFLFTQPLREQLPLSGRKGQRGKRRLRRPGDLKMADSQAVLHVNERSRVVTDNVMKTDGQSSRFQRMFSSQTAALLTYSSAATKSNQPPRNKRLEHNRTTQGRNVFHSEIDRPGSAVEARVLLSTRSSSLLRR